MAKKTIGWHPATGYGMPGDGNTDRAEWEGLTKREHLAALAMQGILASSSISAFDPGSVAGIAEMAVIHADALIIELNK
jgi:hypothetical protein